MKLWGNGIGYGFSSKKQPLWFNEPQELRFITDEEKEIFQDKYGGDAKLTSFNSYKNGIIWGSLKEIDYDKYLVWWSSPSKSQIRRIDKIAKELALAYNILDPTFNHGIKTKEFYKALKNKI